MILPAFRRSVHDNKIAALYGMIVAQARSAVFYTDYGIADTIQGRFDLLVLHLVLVLRRLSREPQAGSAPRRGRRESLGQRLFDAFCGDMDANLREMGVGDMGVPRRMRRFGEEFYGRQAAYQAALDGNDLPALENALARNIFELELVEPRVSQLAGYVRAAVAQLEDASVDVVISGQTVFPNPGAFTGAERRS
jgi:cytochrome b pre-mRNA-processing protein 3